MPIARSTKGLNGNEVVAGAFSETFARRLHHQYAAVALSSAGE